MLSHPGIVTVYEFDNVPDDGPPYVAMEFVEGPSLHEVRVYDTPGAARALDISGSLAYVGDTEWVRVLDLSTPSAPRQIANYKTPSHVMDVWSSDGRVYVANRQAGLLVFDVTPRPSQRAAVDN